MGAERRMASSIQSEDMGRLIRLLKGSPIFNLSLSSKELFHSNLLAWLCDTYPAYAGNLFAEFLKRRLVGIGSVKTLREWNNLDLVVEFEDGQSLVIENKVKSLPYERQLEEYAEAMKGRPYVSFLLLSLSKPYFLDENGSTITLRNGPAWHYLSYAGLAGRLQKIQPAVAILNEYHGQLLADYIGFIRNLDDLNRLFEMRPDDELSDFFGGGEGRTELRGIRLHDMVDKLRYGQLAEAVAERLEKHGVEVIRDGWEKGRPGQVFIESGMTRGMGLFDLKYVIREAGGLGSACILGLQLQSNDFKVYFQLNDKRLAWIMATALLDDKEGSRLWFDLSLSVFYSAEYPKGKIFGQYGGTFLYRYKKLGRISPKSLVDLVIKYVDIIEQNRMVILEKIETQIQPG